MYNDKPTDSKSLDSFDTDALMDEVRNRIVKAQKEAAMATQAASFSPIEEAGQRIRAERKKQGLTLNDLCELSGIAYATLNKIEQGHASVQLDSLGNVARALGMKLWIG
jgi:ribosome-binding protein aMBF1 (putative translation factor)